MTTTAHKLQFITHYKADSLLILVYNVRIPVTSFQNSPNWFGWGRTERKFGRMHDAILNYIAMAVMLYYWTF